MSKAKVHENINPLTHTMLLKLTSVSSIQSPAGEV